MSANYGLNPRRFTNFANPVNLNGKGSRKKLLEEGGRSVTYCPSGMILSEQLFPACLNDSRFPDHITQDRVHLTIDQAGGMEAVSSVKRYPKPPAGERLKFNVDPGNIPLKKFTIPAIIPGISLYPRRRPKKETNSLSKMCTNAFAREATEFEDLQLGRDQFQDLNNTIRRQFLQSSLTHRNGVFYASIPHQTIPAVDTNGNTIPLNGFEGKVGVDQTKPELGMDGNKIFHQAGIKYEVSPDDLRLKIEKENLREKIKIQQAPKILHRAFKGIKMPFSQFTENAIK